MCFFAMPALTNNVVAMTCLGLSLTDRTHVFSIAKGVHHKHTLGWHIGPFSTTPT